MNESQYVEECGRKFRAKHGAKDGWVVFRIDLDSTGTYTPFLPAFLMAEAPEAVVRQNLYYDVGWDEGRRRTALSELPWKRRGPGIDETGWFGEIEILWEGVPIHYHRFTRLTYWGNYYRETTWIATTKRAAFEDLWRTLVRFRRRHFRARRDIHVVNGDWIQRPKWTWDDLILPGAMAAEIRANAESFVQGRAHYKAMKLPYRRGFIFAGPPGVGKTFAAKVLYSRLKAGAYALDLKAEIEDKDLRAAFKRASEDSPAMLLLEDLDRLVGSPKVSMSFLLNLLDGLEPREGILVVATTNAPEKLDQALLHRPSRFDRVWHFPLPGRSERLRLLQRRGARQFSQETLLYAAEKTNGFTMASTQETVVSALLSAVYEKRPPKDSDLIASVDALTRQGRESRVKDGAIRVYNQVGFATATNGQER